MDEKTHKSLLNPIAATTTKIKHMLLLMFPCSLLSHDLGKSENCGTQGRPNAWPATTLSSAPTRGPRNRRRRHGMRRLHGRRCSGRRRSFSLACTNPGCCADATWQGPPSDPHGLQPSWAGPRAWTAESAPRPAPLPAQVTPRRKRRCRPWGGRSRPWGRRANH